MKISSQFDGGNIICLECTDPQNIRLAIKPDNQTDIFQWFYFRLSGAKALDCRLKITNAGVSTYAKGWEDYRAVASYDRQYWFRVPTAYDGKVLSIEHRPEQDSVYYAYFAPYSMERHADLIAKVQQSPFVSARVLGESLDGQAIDLLQIGDMSPGKKPAWVIGRQHPGETMAEWWMEGFIYRLIDGHDPVARKLRQRFTFYVVPNMNPDGSRRGHLRMNAIGLNLNREWAAPDPARSPEVYYVLQEMHKTGVAFNLDVHGDEALPYNFIDGAEGTPAWDDRKQQLLSRYKNALMACNPDFQIEHGYVIAEPGKANLTLCCDHISETFGCLSMTLEMPFKDSAITPDEAQGWSPERCRHLGASTLDAMHKMLDEWV